MNALLERYSHVVPGGRLSSVMIFSLHRESASFSTQANFTVTHLN